MKSKKRVVIAGGGFGGLQLARRLSKKDFDVILVDSQNHHQFQPLFYQVASARLEPATISFPFRKIFQRSTNLKFLLARAQEIIPDQNEIVTSTGSYSYDYLVIATGCQTNYFGRDDIMQHALPMKTTMDAIEIRNRILLGFESLFAAREGNIEELLNIVIVGAGPTGVELAGAFAEMKRYILPRDYPGFDFSALKIILVGGSTSTLNNMSDKAKKASMKYLKELGVDVMTGVFVTGYDGSTVILNNGDTIKCKNLIWAAGVTGNLINGIRPESITRSQRYIVDRQNRIKGYSNIFAIGDIAYMETPLYPNGHPQVANVAINQGKLLARNLKALATGNKMDSYEYRDLGSMATIGKHKAVVDLPFMKFKGYFAWLIWMFLHLMLILSVKNKLMIFITWA
ncbi:MAG TPA: NAD(P)/FAD-dependent oxidoreductase, partial [Bacteroidales bacterium]|nr:NAD(P)/FAD-dependent oxidoreductase [Bacteroidales bacterium]